MGKKIKDDKKDELLTIGPKKTTPIEVTPTAHIEKTIQVTKTKTAAGIEVNNIVPIENVAPVIVEPLAPESIVYELTYMEGTVERIIYTKSLPKFSEKYILNVTNAFGRHDLREVVLGRNEIKTSCNNPLEKDQITIDLRNGLLMKVVVEQEWMNRNFEETQKLFDETVLKAYRDLAAQGITAATPMPGAKSQIKRQPVKSTPVNQAQDDDEQYYQPGNITPSRNGINDF